MPHRKCCYTDLKWLRKDEDGVPFLRNVHHHEVFFSFLDDAGANLFREWWAKYGEKEFGQYVATEEAAETNWHDYLVVEEQPDNQPRFRD